MVKRESLNKNVLTENKNKILGFFSEHLNQFLKVKLTYYQTNLEAYTKFTIFLVQIFKITEH